jgi:hypothetical protein
MAMTETASEPNLTPEEAAKIDALLWDAASADACKVAVLIARATDAAKAAGMEVKPQAIAARIYALAETGKLSVQGNVRRWRAAEVKRGA